jgi:hypothetical protein
MLSIFRSDVDLINILKNVLSIPQTQITGWEQLSEVGLLTQRNENVCSGIFKIRFKTLCNEISQVLEKSGLNKVVGGQEILRIYLYASMVAVYIVNVGRCFTSIVSRNILDTPTLQAVTIISIGMQHCNAQVAVEEIFALTKKNNGVEMKHAKYMMSLRKLILLICFPNAVETDTVHFTSLDMLRGLYWQIPEQVRVDGDVEYSRERQLAYTQTRDMLLFVKDDPVAARINPLYLTGALLLIRNASFYYKTELQLSSTDWFNPTRICSEFNTYEYFEMDLNEIQSVSHYLLSTTLDFESLKQLVPQIGDNSILDTLEQDIMNMIAKARRI